MFLHNIVPYFLNYIFLSSSLWQSQANSSAGIRLRQDLSKCFPPAQQHCSIIQHRRQPARLVGQWPSTSYGPFPGPQPHYGPDGGHPRASSCQLLSCSPTAAPELRWGAWHPPLHRHRRRALQPGGCGRTPPDDPELPAGPAACFWLWQPGLGWWTAVVDQWRHVA